MVLAGIGLRALVGPEGARRQKHNGGAGAGRYQFGDPLPRSGINKFAWQIT
jgi:hypothetical protein